MLPKNAHTYSHINCRSVTSVQSTPVVCYSVLSVVTRDIFMYGSDEFTCPAVRVIGIRGRKEKKPTKKKNINQF